MAEDNVVSPLEFENIAIVRNRRKENPVDMNDEFSTFTNRCELCNDRLHPILVIIPGTNVWACTTCLQTMINRAGHAILNKFP